MKNTYGYIIGAVLLIAVGILLLLQNLGLIESAGGWIWAAAFGLGGIAMLGVFASRPKANWWAVIPGFVLIALGLLIALGDALGEWGGALFLGAIGLSFWVVYFTNRDYWWAVIPGGVLITLTFVIGLSASLEDLAIGGVFFLGLAATFGLVYLLPTPEGRQKWAIFPALVLLIIGVIITLASATILNWLWAAALIIAGFYLIYRSLVSARGGPPAGEEFHFPAQHDDNPLDRQQ